MFGFGILSGLIVLPLIGAGFILILRGEDEATLNNARWAALITTIVTFLLACYAWAHFDSSSSAFQFVEQRGWFGQGLVYKLGVDGMSFPFVVLTAFLMPFCILCLLDAPSTFRVKDFIDRVPGAGNA